jgi:RNA polymerase sigma-70 factor (ECF subfamily)
MSAGRDAKAQRIRAAESSRDACTARLVAHFFVIGVRRPPHSGQWYRRSKGTLSWLWSRFPEAAGRTQGLFQGMSTPPPEFRAIYDAHFDFVWCSLRRLGVREADVLDQAQKVFLTAHFKLAKFEGRSQITTWLFGICQRVASDYRRSALFRREISTDAAEMDLYGGSHEDLSQSAEARQRAAAAEAVLNKLPEAQRVVFVLFELEEMAGPEIAELLGISVGTVRSRLRLAREAFSREVKRLALTQANGRKEAV